MSEARKRTIAVVDDDEGFLGYLSTFLTLRGYGVSQHRTGREIIESVQAGRMPDLVVLDVAMPGIDGVQTLAILKRLVPDLPVIMLSGREESNIIVECVRKGASDYIVKPDDPDGRGEIALEAGIRNVLETQDLMGRSATPALRAASRVAFLDQDVAAAYPTDAGVNDALRALIPPTPRHTRRS